MSRICPAQNFSDFSCPEFVQLVCPEYVQKFPCPEFVQVMCTNSGHGKIPGGRIDHFLGHFPDIPNNF